MARCRRDPLPAHPVKIHSRPGVQPSCSPVRSCCLQKNCLLYCWSSVPVIGPQILGGGIPKSTTCLIVACCWCRLRCLHMALEKGKGICGSFTLLVCSIQDDKK